MILHLLGLAGLAAALLIAGAGASTLIRAVAQDWQHARQVIAATQAGDMEAMVAATKEPPAAARNAPAPARGAGPGAPPPGPWPHRTPLRKRIDVLECGCTWVWDGRARTWEHVPCSPPPATDWDAEMKGLTQ